MSNTVCVLLLSGGLDSATVAVHMRSLGFRLHCLTFDYGQRHRAEIEASANLARYFESIAHQIVNIDAGVFQGSALVDDAIKVPKSSSGSTEIPLTYVPARNTLFLSYALAIAESIGATDIAIGANAVDYSGYPDCRPEFIQQFERLANLGTKVGIESGAFRIHAPLVNLTKSQIIAIGLKHRFDYGLTTSCYDPNDDGSGCGECDSCLIRGRAFAELGLSDPRLRT